MKPGGAPKRKTPMKRTGGPARTGELKRTAMKPTRPRPAVPAPVRTGLAERSGGWCEMKLPGCLGRATDPSHRIRVGMGGRHGPAAEQSSRLSNVLHACRACHDWCHSRPAEAYDLGLFLREGQDPTHEIANTCRYGPVLLDDDGGLWPAGGEEQ